MIIELICGFLAGVGSTALYTRFRNRDFKSINIVKGIVLPTVDDPRWEPYECECKDNRVHAFKLGEVITYDECDEFLSNVSVGEATLRCSKKGKVDPYYYQVERFYMERMAQLSVESEPVKALKPKEN